MLHRLCLLVSLGLMASSASAAGQGKLSAADRKFVEEAAQGGLFEVQAGRLASTKASNAEVRAFGERMVADHGKINDQLQTLTRQLGLTMPTRLNARHQSAYDKLEKLSGASFDRGYMTAMVGDHGADVKKFASQANTAVNPSVRNFAKTTLATLEDHLKQAKAIDSRLGLGVGGTGALPSPPKTITPPHVPVRRR